MHRIPPIAVLLRVCLRRPAPRRRRSCLRRPESFRRPCTSIFTKFPHQRNNIGLSEPEFFSLGPAVRVRFLPPFLTFIVPECFAYQLTHRAVFALSELLRASQHFRRKRD